MLSISHSPNSNFSQQLKSLGSLVIPWKWKSGKAINRFEKAFASYHSVDTAISFSTGREALYAVLKALGVGEGDEVIIQGYTCIVVPNAVMFAGAKPVYADVDETLNLNAKTIEKRITDKTNAVIVQHAFGVPADMASIKALCDKHGIKLIEDCALSLGARVGEQLVGKIGNAAIFSFGRDKVISSVSGGMAIAKDPAVVDQLCSIQADAPHRSSKWIFQNLMHPLLIPWMARLIGNVKIGQVLIRLSQTVGLTNKVYTDQEKRSQLPTGSVRRAHRQSLWAAVYKMPNAMAALALQQFGQLDAFNTHRREVAAKYREFCDNNDIRYQQINPNTDPIYLRFTILIDKPNKLLNAAYRQGFILGDWYKNIVMPMPNEPGQIEYTEGECPVAEKYSRMSVNLPTHWKVKDPHIKTLIDQTANC